MGTSAVRNYKATNEPVLQYLPGSKERQELDAKLKEYDSKVHEIPIVIGEQELTSADVRYQVRVRWDKLCVWPYIIIDDCSFMHFCPLSAVWQG